MFRQNWIIIKKIEESLINLIELLTEFKSGLFSLKKKSRLWKRLFPIIYRARGKNITRKPSKFLKFW